MPSSFNIDRITTISSRRVRRCRVFTADITRYCGPTAKVITPPDQGQKVPFNTSPNKLSPHFVYICPFVKSTVLQKLLNCGGLGWKIRRNFFRKGFF